MTHSAHNIPEDVLDQACQWSVILGDEQVSEDDQQRLKEWLSSSPQHQMAWQRLQWVEQELVPLHPLAQQGSRILQGLAKSRWRCKALCVSVLSIFVLVGISLSLFPHWRADYVTAQGEMRQISLNDGAILYLDSGVALNLEDMGDFTTLRLHSGRILVDSSAAALPHKPRVSTSHGTFTPVGTRFVVTKQGDRSDLMVIQGQVKVNAGGTSRLASAGDGLQVSNDGIATSAGNGIAPDGWVDNVIDANNARLGDVLDVLAPHHRGWLRYHAGVANLRVNGVFHLKDTDKALTSLANTLPIRVEKRLGWWTSVTPR